MSTFPWLTVAGAIPLAGAVVVAAVPGTTSAGEAAQSARDTLVKRLALVFSLATLAVAAAMALRFSPNGPDFQFNQTVRWIPQFGVHYAVGVDGIALVLIVMTAVLTPVVVLASWNAVGADVGTGTGPAGEPPRGAEAGPPRHSVKTYFALMLVLETMMIGAFAATDVFLFYVFFEAMLIPMYFMIGSYGVGQRQYAAVKFLLYSLLGGLLMLVAVIALYVYSARGGHPGTFLFSQLVQVRLSPTVQKWLFLGFFVAFAIKAPLWPFHTWLPDAAASAQPGDAVLMIGVMDKVGTFGMIRYCLELFPSASHYFTPLVIALAVIGILYPAIVAIGQADLKRLVAYVSVAGVALITNYGGVQKVAPVLAGLFLIAGLAGLALPGLSTFVSEFLVLVGTFTRYEVPAILATMGIILAAVYILWMYQRTMTGPAGDNVAGMPDLRARELWAVGPLIALIIVLGVYPKPVIDVINPAVHRTLVQVHSTDPVPPHPASAAQQKGGAR